MNPNNAGVVNSQGKLVTQRFLDAQKKPSNVITSDMMGTGTTFSDVANRRNQLVADRQASEAQLQNLQTQTLSAGAMTPEEISAQNSLNEITQRERQVALGARRELEGLYGAGLTDVQRAGFGSEVGRVANATLADIALQKLAASDTLSSLTGVRQSRLDNLKTALGFEDKRLERLLGLETEFRGLDKEEKTQAREDIASILEFAKGMEFDELDAQSQQQIIGAVANTPFTLGAIKQALLRNKVAVKDEQTKNALSLDVQRSQIAQNRASEAKAYADIAKTNAEKEKILAETTPNTSSAQDQKQATLTLAQELRSDSAVGKSSAVGASAAKFVPFGQSLGLQGARSAFEQRVDTLKANLTLDNLKLLKGAMSDKDLLFLNSIGSSLNVNMSETEFNKELDKVVEKLGGTSGGGVTVTTPDGMTFTFPDKASADQFKKEAGL